jgi:glutathione S-transferase
MGKAPMLVLDDEKKTTLIESQAICDYLLNAVATPEQKKQYFGNGGEIEAAIVKGWAAWAEATLMTHAIVSCTDTRSSCSGA